MTVWAVHNEPLAPNNWRPHEREQLAIAFGQEVIDVGIGEAQPAAGDACYWKLHAERTTSMQLSLAQETQRAAEAVGAACINKPSGWMAIHAKEVCWQQWQAAGIPVPMWTEVNGLADLPRVELAVDGYPMLLRYNDSVSGEHSYAVSNPDEAKYALSRLFCADADDIRRRWGDGVGRKVVAVEFHETATDASPYRKSYRIIVAGSEVITGYARLAAPPEWVAIAGKFRPEMGEAWLCAMADCQYFMELHGDLLAQSAAAAGVDLVGIDVIPLPDGTHRWLEVQPDFSCGNPRGGDTPPWYNPSYPALIAFIKGNWSKLRLMAPWYTDRFLPKDELFRLAWAAVYNKLSKCERKDNAKD